MLGLPKRWTLLQLQTVRAFDSSPFWHSLSPRFLLSPYLSLLCHSPEDMSHTPAHYMSPWSPQPANHSSLLLTHLQATCCSLIQDRHAPSLHDSNCLQGRKTRSHRIWLHKVRQSSALTLPPSLSTD